MAKVTLPDGKVLEVENGATLGQVAEKIGPGLAKAALAAEVNGKIVDLSTPVTEDIKISIITGKSPGALEILRHSCAHVMAEAICSLWPKTLLFYGPTVEDG
ncbi:MAG: TGS domain-containing protein, partial [Phycisphaerales bacterium]